MSTLIGFTIGAACGTVASMKWLHDMADSHNQEKKEWSDTLGASERKFMQEANIIVRDVNHPLKEQKYLDEVEQGVYNPLHAFLGAEHFLRQGPSIGNFILVPGGGPFPRPWTVDGSTRRQDVQLSYLRKFNEWPEHRDQIPITKLAAARSLMSSALFPTAVYSNVAARLLGSSVEKETLPCNPFEQDLVDVIVKHATSSK
jgi:hypothetical protein